MTKLTPEEKRKEAGDWLQGIIALALGLSIILVGYLIFQHIQKNIIEHETKNIPVEKTTWKDFIKFNFSANGGNSLCLK